MTKLNECPSLREVLEILEKEFPTPQTEPRRIPRSLPEWLTAGGYCEIDARDEAWSRAGYEIH